MKIFKSKIVAVVVTLAMVFSVLAVPVAADQTAPAAPAAPAAQTTQAAPATVTQPATTADAATFLQSKGLLQGDQNGNLMLDQNLTREQMVVILSRLTGQEAQAKAYPTDNMPFTDVPLDSEYAPYIAWAYDNMITQGYDATTFGFSDSLTAEQTKLFFVRVLGYTNLSDADQLAKADALKITAGSTAADKVAIKRADMALLMSNTVFATNSNGKVLGTTINGSDGKPVVSSSTTTPPPPVTTPLTITASMATASSVKVTFNRAVADTSKITFTLTGVVAVPTTVTWSSDSTTATLTSSSTLLAGTYTVKAAGDTFAANGDTATLTVVANGAAKIAFASDKLVKAAGTTATLRYQILDNYGVDITSSTLASDLTIASSKALATGSAFTIDPLNPGIMTVNFATALDYLNTEKSVSMTIIDTKTGVATSATLNSAAPAQADAVAFGTVTYPVTSPVTTKIIVKNATAAYIPLTLTDQYGNAITDVNKLGANDVVYSKSDSRLNLVAENYTDSNNKQGIRLRVDTSAIQTAETVSVTAVTTLAGKSASITLNIQEAAKPDKVSLGAQTQIVAAGDAANTLVIPISAVDQYGVQLTKDDIVTASNWTITTSPNTLQVGIATTGDNKACLVNTSAIPAKGTYVVTLSTGTNVATYTVTVNDAAYENTIQVDTTPATNLLQGAVAKVNYKFIDQYNRAVKTPSASTKVTLETGNASILTVNGSAHPSTSVLVTNASAVSGNNKVSVSTLSTQGTDTLTAKLYSQDGTSVISTVSSTFNVTSGVPGNLTFSIADVPTLYGAYSTTTAPAMSANDQYATALNITAKDSSGTTYAIPANRIMNVATSDPTVVGVVQNTATTSAAIAVQQNNPLVYGLGTAFQSTDPSTATKTATITVQISTDTGIQSVTKTVTVAKAAPQVTSVVFADTPIDSVHPYGLPTGAKTITSIGGTTTNINTTPVYIYTVDNYGVYSQVNPTTLTSVNVDRFFGTLGYVNNELVFNSSQIQPNKDVYVMYTAANGVYGTFVIRATDGAHN